MTCTVVVSIQGRRRRTARPGNCNEYGDFLRRAKARRTSRVRAPLRPRRPADAGAGLASIWRAQMRTAPRVGPGRRCHPDDSPCRLRERRGSVEGRGIDRDARDVSRLIHWKVASATHGGASSRRAKALLQCVPSERFGCVQCDLLGNAISSLINGVGPSQRAIAPAVEIS